MKLTVRQKEVLEISLDLLAEGGLPNLTMRKIANRMQVTEPAVYRHFESKSTIILSMIEHFAEADEIPAGQGIVGVGNFIRSRLTKFEANPRLAKLIFAGDSFQGVPEYAQALRKMMHGHGDFLKNCFETAIADNEIRLATNPDTLFILVMGPIRMLIQEWVLSERSFSLTDAGEKLWQTIELSIQK